MDGRQIKRSKKKREPLDAQMEKGEIINLVYFYFIKIKKYVIQKLY